METALQALRPGQALQVATGAPRRRWTFRGASAAMVWLEPDGGGHGVSATDSVLRRAIDTIWARDDHTAQGWVIGMIAGVVAWRVIDSPLTTANRGARATNGMLAFMANPVIGAVVGHFVPEWRRRYP
jgi:hypothetical protein